MSSGAPTAAAAKEGPSAKTILVVDDEKNIRRTLQLVLEGEGYRVKGAESAEEGLALLAAPNTPVDLAIFESRWSGCRWLKRSSASERKTRRRTFPSSSSVATRP